MLEVLAAPPCGLNFSGFGGASLLFEAMDEPPLGAVAHPAELPRLLRGELLCTKPAPLPAINAGRPLLSRFP